MINPQRPPPCVVNQWIEKLTGYDIVYNGRYARKHSLDDECQQTKYLSYRVGFQSLSAIDLLHRPALASALRNLPYPIFGRSIALPEQLFGYNQCGEGLDDLIECLNWLKAERNQLLTDKLPFDKAANHLLHLYENELSSPFIQSHEVITNAYQQTVATTLIIATMPYTIYNSAYTREGYELDENHKIMATLCLRDLLPDGVYKKMDGLRISGYIEHTPLLRVHAKQTYKHKGHHIWCDISNGNVMRKMSDVNRYAKRYSGDDYPLLLNIGEMG
tara:strand:- start:36376 stop:37197 length:822 start_codon:yes stop_codon:yes gene_type:complete